MSIRERVLLSQMLLKMDKHKEYSKMIGVEDVSCGGTSMPANEWSPSSQWKVIISVTPVYVTIRYFVFFFLNDLVSVRRSMLFIEE